MQFPLFLFSIFFHPIFCQEDHSIVFIHIGEEIPSYAKVALRQARAFNPDCPIIFLANEKAIEKWALSNEENVTYLACESLQKTEAHKAFLQNSVLNSEWREGFWRNTSERFLYLADLMQDYSLSHVFHLEYDNMLYRDVGELMPILLEHYPGIAGVFDNDERCVPGFIYFSSAEVCTRLAETFARLAHTGKHDMEIISLFHKQYGASSIDFLPIIHQKYVDDKPLVSARGHRVADKYRYCQNSGQFGSIFDAAAIGQYLGGIDPRNDHSEPGFVNESCVFNVSHLEFKWVEDSLRRRVPYACYQKKCLPIVNLHIHSKNLRTFASTRAIGGP